MCSPLLWYKALSLTSVLLGLHPLTRMSIHHPLGPCLASESPLRTPLHGPLTRSLLKIFASTHINRLRNVNHGQLLGQEEEFEPLRRRQTFLEARTDLLHGASSQWALSEDWISWCCGTGQWKRSMALDTGIASLFSCPDEPSWQISVLQSRLLSFCGKLLFIICSSIKGHWST